MMLSPFLMCLRLLNDAIKNRDSIQSMSELIAAIPLLFSRQPSSYAIPRSAEQLTDSAWRSTGRQFFDAVQSVVHEAPKTHTTHVQR